MDEELPDHLVAPVLGAVRMTAPDAEVPDWSFKPDMPPEQIKATAEHFLRTNAIANRSYDETKANWERHFPGVDAPSEDQYGYWKERAPTETLLDMTRAQAAKDIPDLKGQVVTPNDPNWQLENTRLAQSLPPVQWGMDWRYKQAMRRYESGNPDGEDLGVIARVERQHQLRSADEQGFVGKLRGLSLGVPFAIGEMMMAGKMAAPVAGAMTPAALAGATGPLAATARFGIGAAATAATFPSMGPKAVADIMADPRQAPKEAVEAIGKALVMHGVGQLQGLTAQLGGGPAMQLAASAAAFPAGNAAMEAVNHALGLETSWGTIGDLANKDRRGEGIASLIIGALEGVAMVGLTHGPEVAKGIADAIPPAVDHGRKQGFSPQASADRVSRIVDFAKKPSSIKADMPIDQMKDGPLKDLGLLVQKTLPNAVALPDQGIVRAVYADKPITLKMDPDGTVDVSFKHDPRSGKVGIAEEQPNSAAMGFGRKLLGLVKGLGESGVSLKYQTLDESGQFDTDKARSYASALTRAGYERVAEPAEGDPGGFHVWKPKAEAEPATEPVEAAAQTAKSPVVSSSEQKPPEVPTPAPGASGPRPATSAEAQAAPSGPEASNAKTPPTADLKSAVHRTFTELMKESPADGMVKISDIREAIRREFGDKAASHEVLDEILWEMKRAKQLKWLSISDRSRATEKEINGGVKGVGEQFFYLEHVEAPPAPEAPGASNAKATFKTSLGSTYEAHGDGTTTRTKADHTAQGHEAADQGAKERSARTVYVADNPSALSAAGLNNVGPKGARLVIKDGKATLLTWNEAAGRWGAAPSGRDIPVSDKPAVGLHPLELWQKSDDVPGHEAYRKQHAGNRITEVSEGTPKAPQTPREQADALEAEVKAKRQELTDQKVKPAEISRRLRADEKRLDGLRQEAAKSELKPITEADSAELLNRLDQPGHGLDEGEEYILRRRLDKTNQGSHRLISKEKPELGTYTEVLNKEKEALQKLGYEGTVARLHSHELGTSAMADVQSGKMLAGGELHYADPENVYHNQTIEGLDKIDAAIERLYRDKVKGKIDDGQFKSEFARLKGLADAGQKAAVSGGRKPGPREQVAAEAGHEGPSESVEDLPEGIGAAGGGRVESPPPPGTPGAAAPGGPAPDQPPPAKNWFQSAKDFLKSFAQQQFPSTTRISREAGEALAQAANAPTAAKATWNYMSRILKIDGKAIGDLSEAEQRLYGATWLERRMRYYRDWLRKQGENTSKVGTLIGQEGSPLKTEADYQDAYEKMGFFWEAVKQEWTPEVEKNFRDLKGLEPDEVIEAKSQIPGIPLNAIALTEGDPAQGVVGTGRKQGLENLRLRKPGFLKTAELSAAAYDVNLHHMMQKTLNQGIPSAARAVAVKEGVDRGTLQAVTGSDKPNKGFRYLGLDPAYGLSKLDPKARYYVHPDAYRDYVQGLGIGERPGQLLNGLRAFTDKLYSVSLMSPVELATHIGNHFTALFRSGMGVPILNLKDSFANAYRVWQKEPEIMRRVMELAKIGSSFEHESKPGLLGEKLAKYDPTAYLNKFTSKLIDTMQKGVRVQLEDAYDRNVRAGAFPDTATGKRDFVNSALGNYNSQASNRFTQFLKDTGLQSFATAATTFTVQGTKAGVFSAINAPALTNKQAVQLRAAALLKILPVLAIGPVVNAMRWGNAFPPGVPALAVKTRDDEDGKTHYIDPLRFTGVRRGWRMLGINAAIEGQIQGLTKGQMLDKGVGDFVHGVEHFMAGPPVQFAHTALTGENAMGHQIAAKVSTATTPAGIAAAQKRGAPEPGSSQKWENLKAAVLSLNPLIGSFTGADRPKTPRTFVENLMQSAGPFGEQTRAAPKKK